MHPPGQGSEALPGQYANQQYGYQYPSQVQFNTPPSGQGYGSPLSQHPNQQYGHTAQIQDGAFQNQFDIVDRQTDVVRRSYGLPQIQHGGPPPGAFNFSQGPSYASSQGSPYTDMTFEAPPSCAFLERVVSIYRSIGRKDEPFTDYKTFPHNARIWIDDESCGKSVSFWEKYDWLVGRGSISTGPKAH
ncbi:hypothetical protein MMC10_010909 [Thelotrema lepadinum]|nr:hypothetical protein [Thelotrema lepadinum]